mgnify:CR=1 FL=1
MKKVFRDMLKERGRDALPSVLLVSAECAPLSKTGGLADSVPPYEPETETGLGFTFGSVDPGDMLDAIRRAVDTYYNDKEAWTGLMKRGMTADFSWDKSAKDYLDIYTSLLD